jgi:outer membrane protein TolC
MDLATSRKGVLCLLAVIGFLAGWPGAQGENPVNLSKPLTLADCLRMALQNNPGLIEADLQVTSAQAGVLSAASSLLPQVSVRSGWNRSGPATRTRLDPFGQLQLDEGGSSDSYGTSFSLSQSLISVSDWAGVARARASRDGSVWLRTETRRNLVLEVKRNYYALLKAKQLADVSQAALEQNQEQLKRAQVTYDLGTARKSDLLKAKMSLSEAELGIITARNNIRNAASTLCITLGLDPGIPLDVVPAPPARMDSLELAGCLREARERRAELARGRARIEEANASVWAARSRWIPSLSASGSYGASDSRFPRTSADWTDNDYWSVGVAASLSLFDGFSSLAGVRQASAALKTARQELRLAELQVGFDVEQAYRAYMVARQKVGVARQGVESADEEYRLTSEEYRLGAATMLDLLTSQVALTQARVNEVQALTDFHVAQAELERAMGTESTF